MPTGYTAPVEDGSITDLRAYALRCARNTGHLYSTLQDVPLDAPIPAVLTADLTYWRHAP